MRRNRGFTLLEVLIGTAVLSMMVFIIWTITSTTLDSEDRVQKRDEIYQMARIALRRVTDDLSMSFLVSNKELLGKTSDGSDIETAFIGDDRGDFDAMDFNSFSNWRMFRNSKESDKLEVGFFTEPDPDNPEEFRLMRRQNPYLDNDVTKGGKVYPLAENVKAFQLSYYDGKQNDWTQNWNSKEIDLKDQMPKAVKIEISFQDPVQADELITFTTIAFIPMWESPINF